MLKNIFLGRIASCPKMCVSNSLNFLVYLIYWALNMVTEGKTIFSVYCLTLDFLISYYISPTWAQTDLTPTSKSTTEKNNIKRPPLMHIWSKMWKITLCFWFEKCLILKIFSTGFFCREPTKKKKFRSTKIWIYHSCLIIPIFACIVICTPWRINKS